MSQYMFLGLKNKLKKIDYEANEIYNIPKIYKNSIYFQEGILFDENIDKFHIQLLNDYCKLNWYIVKTLPVPFEAATRYKEDFPDLYEAALQMSTWFSKFVKKLKEQGNDVVVINLWISDKKEKRTTDKKTLKLSEVDLSNYEMPRDILYNLEL